MHVHKYQYRLVFFDDGDLFTSDSNEWCSVIWWSKRNIHSNYSHLYYSSSLNLWLMVWCQIAQSELEWLGYNKRIKIYMFSGYNLICCSIQPRTTSVYVWPGGISVWPWMDVSLVSCQFCLGDDDSKPSISPIMYYNVCITQTFSQHFDHCETLWHKVHYPSAQ